MENMWSSMKMATNRRSFLKNGLAVSAGVGLLTRDSSALADDGFDDRSGRLTRGDAALLRFAAAAEILETDFWVQYNELAGIQDKEEPSGSGNPAFTACSFGIGRGHGPVHPRQYRRRIYPPELPQRVSGFEGSSDR